MPQAKAATGTRRGKAKKEKPVQSGWRRGLDIFLICLSVFCAVALLATAYGGYLSPLKYGGKVGILPLCFPFVTAAGMAVLLVDAFFSRAGVFIAGIGFLLCAGPLLDFFPLNVTESKAKEGTETFTLLSYNVYQFEPREEADADGKRTLAYILERDADIVCLQEALLLTPSEKTGITASQADSLHSKYPNIIHSNDGQCILSKFEVNPIHLNTNDNSFAGGDIGAYRVTLPSGRLIGIFNVHLNSYSLTDDDKELYHDLTKLQREPIKDIRNQLLDKLAAAAVGRARQTQQLIRWLRLYGGPDAIVCGDFNDVTNCYAIHTLADAGFRDVYPRVGFGPMHTYNANRFYFCIDHIMSRGALKPLWLKKGHLRSSDHYPIEVEFSIAGDGDDL